MVKKKPETKIIEKCRHCGSEIAPCQTGQFCCYGRGWVHIENQIHGCPDSVEVAEPEMITVD